MKNHTTLCSIDGHVDLLYDLQRHHPNCSFPDLTNAWISNDRLHEGAVTIFAGAIYCNDAMDGPRHAAKNLLSLLAYMDRHMNSLPILCTAKQLAEHWHGGKSPGMVLLLENADALLDLALEEILERGIRIVGLTHGGRNRLGDGNAVIHASGLTESGKKLAGSLDRAGCAIDTAHLSEQSFHDLMNLYEGPLINSHTGLRAFHDIPRNLHDWQIRHIVDQGGVVGIAACPELLAPDNTADIDIFFRHIDYCVQRFGAETVGIGSDFGGYDSICRGLEHHGCFPAVARLLDKAGYPATAIQAIMGGNWLRVYGKLLSPQSSDDTMERSPRCPQGIHPSFNSCIIDQGRSMVGLDPGIDNQ